MSIRNPPRATPAVNATDPVSAWTAPQSNPVVTRWPPGLTGASYQVRASEPGGVRPLQAACRVSAGLDPREAAHGHQPAEGDDERGGHQPDVAAAIPRGRVQQVIAIGLTHDVIEPLHVSLLPSLL